MSNIKVAIPRNIDHVKALMYTGDNAEEIKKFVGNNAHVYEDPNGFIAIFLFSNRSSDEIRLMKREYLVKFNNGNIKTYNEFMFEALYEIVGEELDG